MHKNSPGSEQQFFARVAGFTYLFNYMTSVFGVAALPWISGSGDFAQRSARILASEHLYRIALTSIALGWVSIVILAFALYVTLAGTNKRLAQLALYLELGQASVGAVSVILSFMALKLYTTPHIVGIFQRDQLHALVRAIGSGTDNGFNMSMLFFSPGSLIFFCLFYRSGYIPKALAAIGVFGSATMLLVTMGMLILPEHGAMLQFGWAPMGIAELTTGCWLLVKGVRPPQIVSPG